MEIVFFKRHYYMQDNPCLILLKPHYDKGRLLLMCSSFQSFLVYILQKKETEELYDRKLTVPTEWGNDQS